MARRAKARLSGVRALGLVALASCSSKPAPVERRDGGARRDGASISDAADAAASRPDGGASESSEALKARAEAMAAAGYVVDEVAAAAGGGVRVFVRWPDIPSVRRTSPAGDACASPRAPSAVVDELWGVAEVAVALVVARGKDFPNGAPPRLTADGCAISPRVVVAAPGQPVLLESAAAASTTVHLERRAWKGLAREGEQLGERVVALPWRGHAAQLVTTAAELWLVAPEAPGGGRGDGAVALVAPHPYVAVTDGDGLAVFRDVPAGEHEVVAWLPPRAGARAHSFAGKVIVTAGQAAEVVLTP